ncbi:sugar transporter [Plasmodium gonderi]|uniref:Sugar transporter n=1 Tax=Plasmodium gonderi TaxID=77519 RepID=A0A1Y1JJG6_PLAGO|nr:sugar transporter [Plasmodium gonderi]GAW80224.1 sugar transporter [Plasmodium gonderi]
MDENNRLKKNMNKENNSVHAAENGKMNEMRNVENEEKSFYIDKLNAHVNEKSTYCYDNVKENISDDRKRSEVITITQRFPLIINSDVSTPKSEIYELDIQNKNYENNRNVYHQLLSTQYSNVTDKGIKKQFLPHIGSVQGAVLNNINTDTLSSYTIYQGCGEEYILKNSTGISENNSISNYSFHGGIISNDLINREIHRQGEFSKVDHSNRICNYENSVTSPNTGHCHLKEVYINSLHPSSSDMNNNCFAHIPQEENKTRQHRDSVRNCVPINNEHMGKQTNRNLVCAKNVFIQNKLNMNERMKNINNCSNIRLQKESYITHDNYMIMRNIMNDYDNSVKTHEYLIPTQCANSVDSVRHMHHNIFHSHPKNASSRDANYVTFNSEGNNSIPHKGTRTRSSLLLKNCISYKFPNEHSSYEDPNGYKYIQQFNMNRNIMHGMPQEKEKNKCVLEKRIQPDHIVGVVHPSNEYKMKNAKLNEGENIGLYKQKGHKVFVKNISLRNDEQNVPKKCVVKNKVRRNSLKNHSDKINKNNNLKFVIPVNTPSTHENDGDPSEGEKNKKKKKKKKNCKQEYEQEHEEKNMEDMKNVHSFFREGNEHEKNAERSVRNIQNTQTVYMEKNEKNEKNTREKEIGVMSEDSLNRREGGGDPCELYRHKEKKGNSWKNGKNNYYTKKGNLSYSGLLTSMVSSILTQQNERKSQEINCFNYSWKGNEYDYTMLHQQEEKNVGENNEEEVNKAEINKEEINKEDYNKYMISSTLIQQLRGKTTNEHILQLTLILMICISVLCNYDHGAIPVTLEEIQKDFPLSYIEQSLLGSLVYFGLIIGTIIASVLFELVTAKLLVTISTLLLSISLYIFSHANCITFMYISRFVNGLCQAIPVVYLPVWVDEFSPREKATQWMSYIQLASIGGTVFGYFLGGILSNNSYSYSNQNSPFSNVTFFTTWRSPFLIQAFLLIPLFFIMIFIPSDMINISSSASVNSESDEEGITTANLTMSTINNVSRNEIKKQIKDKNITLQNDMYDNTYQEGYNQNIHQFDSVKGYSKYSMMNSMERIKFKGSRKFYYESSSNTFKRNFNRSATYIMEKKTNVLKKTFKEVKKLLNNKLYIIITLGMSNLYFVVTGIQFWITEYMSVVLLTEKIKIVTVSTLCFLTSPTSGVWFGGFVCDLFGGYKNTNYSKTIKVATAFAISACIFGILSAHLNNFIFFSISLWLCLFTGSALVPVAVGMLLSCVNNHQKSLSSAVSQIIYNVFGWFSAPLLSGIIMDIMHKYTNDNRLALKAGFTMILYSSFIGFLLLFYANFLDFSDKKENDELIELEEPLT